MSILQSAETAGKEHGRLVAETVMRSVVKAICDAARAVSVDGRVASSWMTEKNLLAVVTGSTTPTLAPQTLKKKKRPSGWLAFSKEKRADVKAAHPELKSGEITRELGRLWRELPMSARQEYEGRKLLRVAQDEILDQSLHELDSLQETTVLN